MELETQTYLVPLAVSRLVAIALDQVTAEVADRSAERTRRRDVAGRLIVAAVTSEETHGRCEPAKLSELVDNLAKRRVALGTSPRKRGVAVKIIAQFPTEFREEIELQAFSQGTSIRKSLALLLERGLSLYLAGLISIEPEEPWPRPVRRR